MVEALFSKDFTTAAELNLAGAADHILLLCVLLPKFEEPIGG